ncbi:MAG: Sapep family Mn(2+)-dependent dipeptidase [Evtepia sp.]
MNQNVIDTYFSTLEPDFVEAISRLVRIPSTRSASKPGMPFGEGPTRALEEALLLAADLGFSDCHNEDGYVGTVDLNDKDTCLHILTHLDVVDAGSQWTVTDPFQPKRVGDLLYGRGTDDDKGPLVAALFAMKAVRDLAVPLRHNVRLIMGTDEECGFEDIHHYYETHPYAPHTFSPDASFPLINTEKGHYQPSFSKDFLFRNQILSPNVISIHAGTRVNVVPATATAVVSGLSFAAIARAAEDLDILITLERKDDSVQINCSGQNAHASTPECGNNALTALLALLAKLPLADCDRSQSIRAIHALFPHGDHHGHAAGIAQSDEISGHLTLALTMLYLNDQGLSGRFDCRTPLCATTETCVTPLLTAFNRHGFSVNGILDPAHHTPSDSPFVQTLLRVYEQYTGLPGTCESMGGGTYVHGIPGGVAFGASMPGFDSHLHAPDERVNIKDLMTAAKIFTQVILDLCA